MSAKQQVAAIVELVQAAYPGWDSCADPAFAAAEIAPLRKLQQHVMAVLNAKAVAASVERGDAAQVVQQIEQIGRSARYLYSGGAQRGDLAVLYAADFDPAVFGAAFAALLDTERPLPERIEAFGQRITARGWPHKWSFATFFLALSEPQHAFFVKPRLTKWFLQFSGRTERLTPIPAGTTYQAICEQAAALCDALRLVGVSDLIDVYAVVNVAYTESHARTGRLTARGQVELDRPPSVYQPAAAPVQALHEGQSTYIADAQPPLSLAQVAETLAVPETAVRRWVAALERKGQIIFYGAPGTGKTFAAQTLARYLVGGGNGFQQVVQFHAAYAYEDFVQGIRPHVRDGHLHYERQPGRFVEFVNEAQGRDRCVLIIDEINRANVAQVLGELMYLLEYRSATVPLAAGGSLSIPPNVLIIGTMNTADRSIALVDHALRRRFALIALRPNYALLHRFHAASELPFSIERLSAILQEINQQIEPDYQLGVSYFLTTELGSALPDIWQLEIEPYLDEYFFDQRGRMDSYRWTHISTKLDD